MYERILLIFGIFFVVLVLTQALTAPITGTSAQSRRLLRKRITQLAKNQVLEIEHISLVRHSYTQSLTPLEQWLESWPILTPLIRLHEQAGVEILACRILFLGIFGAIAALILTPFISQTEFVIVVATVLAGLAPWIWLKRKKAQRLLKFEETLPDALSMLARTLRAGLPLTQALQTVSQEMTGPVAKEFGIVFSELNYGGDLRSAFLAMLERIPSVAVMSMAVAIMIQRETGGNLAQSVDQLEGMLRERFRFQRHLRTLTASNRNSAMIVGILPFALAVILELLQPGHMSIIFTNPMGLKLLYVVLFILGLGMLWIRQMLRLDI